MKIGSLIKFMPAFFKEDGEPTELADLFPDLNPETVYEVLEVKTTSWNSTWGPEFTGASIIKDVATQAVFNINETRDFWCFTGPKWNEEYQLMEEVDANTN